MIPAPIPPTKRKSPRMVAIILPPPNFFLGGVVSVGTSVGPEDVGAGGGALGDMGVVCVVVVVVVVATGTVGVVCAGGTAGAT